MAEEESKAENLDELLEPLLRLYERVLDSIAQSYSRRLINKGEFYRKHSMLRTTLLCSVHDYNSYIQLRASMQKKFDEVRSKYRIDIFFDKFPRRL